MTSVTGMTAFVGSGTASTTDSCGTWTTVVAATGESSMACDCGSEEVVRVGVSLGGCVRARVNTYCDEKLYASHITLNIEMYLSIVPFFYFEN